MKVKICGLTRIEDAQLAIELGATELGFIFAKSPRQISVSKALEIREKMPDFVNVFGVFVNEKAEEMVRIAEVVGLTGLQLHGQESAEEILRIRELNADLIIMKAIGVKEQEYVLDPSLYSNCDALLFDSAGSHFKTEERGVIQKTLLSDKPFFLAGGLNSQNTVALIEKHRPHGIDLSSGVESSPGIKDDYLLKNFFSVIKDYL